MALLTNAVTAVVVLLPVAGSSEVGQAVAALHDQPGVYLAKSAEGDPLSRSDVSALSETVRAASSPIFIAALGEPSRTQADSDLRALIDGVHQQGTYVVVGTGGFVAGSDVPGVEGQTPTLVQQAIAANRGRPLLELQEFVRLVDDAAGSAAGNDNGGGVGTAVPPPVRNSGHSSFPWTPIVVLAIIGLGLVALFRRGASRRHRDEVAALAAVKAAAEQDVTALGEQLAALEVPPAGAPEATDDYRAALDAYDRAKAALAAARHPDDLRAVTSALEEGRWRLGCVRARLAGGPLPERRPPCFFNPQHGPSATDVSWAPPGGQPRPVPVCAADAERLARGQDPDERLVPVGAVSMPYWQAPAYYRPYASGFFGGWGGGSFLGGLLLGEMLAGPGFGGWGSYDAGAYDAGYGAGWNAGQDAGDGGDFAGSFDAGGGGWGDNSGGGWGGGDFGGGDNGGGGWGGGDFGGGDNSGGW